MEYIGWDVVNGEIIKTFIKLRMFGNFDAISLWIIPNDVLSSVWEVTEEYTGFGG